MAFTRLAPIPTAAAAVYVQLCFDQPYREAATVYASVWSIIKMLMLRLHSQAGSGFSPLSPSNLLEGCIFNGLGTMQGPTRPFMRAVNVNKMMLLFGHT